MAKKIIKKIIMFVSGMAVMILGIALVLLWWPYSVYVFKGLAGIFLALIGLGILFFIKD